MGFSSVPTRVVSAVGRALRPAFTTTRFLASVMVPVSLAVLLLSKSGILAFFARALDPIMHLIGLPGEASLVFISSMLLNIYSAIAVIQNLDLSAREVIILASMCLIAHNLIVECTVMKKTGSSASKMLLLRIGVALGTGWLLNLMLPGGYEPFTAHAVAAPGTGEALGLDLIQLPSILGAWAMDSGALILKIALIVTGLMIIQKVLEEFGIMELLGKAMSPIMRILGLPSSAGFLWIVANVVGFSYGSAIMIDRSDSGKLTLTEADLFNHHASINHSMLEDTLLFAAIGVPPLLSLLPRLIMAIIVVWLERARRALFRRSFRIGTM
jgi:spore maturation protein SpmB